MNIYQSERSNAPVIVQVVEFSPWPFMDSEVFLTVPMYLAVSGRMDERGPTLNREEDDCLVIFSTGECAVGSWAGVLNYCDQNGHDVPRLEVRP